jgi:hypothetical protein
LEGKLLAILPSAPRFNCYAYACDPNPKNLLNWIGPRFQGRSGINLIQIFMNHGWHQINHPPTAPPPPGTAYIALYMLHDTFQHAAVWTADAVYAKMGELGAFQFSSLAQLAGGMYGEPKVYLSQTQTPVNTRPQASCQGFLNQANTIGGPVGRCQLLCMYKLCLNNGGLWGSPQYNRGCGPRCGQ